MIMDSQITNFLKSVYLRLREIKYNEKFPNQQTFILANILLRLQIIVLEENA